MKRVGLYVRVSTEEQRDHGMSIDSQLEALKEYCKEHKYIIAGIYNDAGISARKSYKNRPALLQLMEDCKNGNIDLILFSKLDRWFRSVGDYYEVQRVLDEYGVKWRCIWEDYETETSSGVFKVNIMLSVAQSEADRTSERIKKVFEYKKAKGEVCSGSVGWGYKIQDKKWVKDKEVEPLVNEFFNTYLSTFSIRKTQDKMLSLGVTIPTTTIQKLTSSPAYYGELSYVTEPYITKEQHEAIVKAKKSCIRRRKFDYIFSGLGRCSKCGASLVAHSTPSKLANGKDTNSISYYCDKNNKYKYLCDGVSINEKVIEKCLLDNLESALTAHNDSIKKYTLSVNSMSKGNATKIKNRLSRLKDLYELGDIELDEYKQKRDQLLEELNKIEAPKEVKEIKLPDNWKEVYLSLDSTLKNAFWLKTIDHFEVSTRRASTIQIFF